MFSIETSLKICCLVRSQLDVVELRINSLPNDKFLAWSKLKAFADDKFLVAEMMISVFDRVENIVEKGENAGYQHFLLFPQCFQKASYTRSLKKSKLCGKRVKQRFFSFFSQTSS